MAPKTQTTYFVIKGELFTNDAGEKINQGRDFGIVFSLIATILYAVRVYRGYTNDPLTLVLLVLSAGLLLTALFAPTILSTPARLWQKVGETIGRVMSIVIVSLTFLIVIIPFAIVLKLVKKDLLLLKKKKESNQSYWIPVDNSLKNTESYSNPF